MSLSYLTRIVFKNTSLPNMIQIYGCKIGFICLTEVSHTYR